MSTLHVSAPSGRWRRSPISYVLPPVDADGMRAANPDVSMRLDDLLRLVFALHEAAGVLEVYSNRAGDAADAPTRIAIECFRGCADDFDPRPREESDP